MTIRDILDTAGRIIAAATDSDPAELAWAVGVTVLSNHDMAALLDGNLHLGACTGSPGRGRNAVSWDDTGARISTGRTGHAVEVAAIRWADVAAILHRIPAALLADVITQPIAVWAACRPTPQPTNLLDLLTTETRQ